jgi:signal transduction histidine kinase
MLLFGVKRPVWPLIIVLVVEFLGIAGSYILANHMGWQAENRLFERAESDAKRMTTAVDSALSHNETTLRSVSIAFGGSLEAARRGFELADTVLGDQVLQTGFTSLAYVERVSPGRRAELETRLGRPLSKLGNGDGASTGGIEHFPVILRQGKDDLIPVGTDLASHPAVRSALMGALDTEGEVVMSPAFRSSDSWWTVMALRVPNAGRPGLIVGLLNVSELLDKVLRDGPAGLGLRLRQSEMDGSGGPEEVILSTHGRRAAGKKARGVVDLRSELGQAQWHFTWSVQPDYDNGEYENIRLTFILGGSTLSILIALLIGILLRQNADIRRRVRDRTAELARARDEAELANRAKTVFLANMSHELRTPLNAIIGFSEVIRDQMMGPVGQERYSSYAGDIHDSGKHLLDLINELLDVAKAEAGKLDIRDEEIDLRQMIDSCLRLVGNRAAEAKVQLLSLVDDEVPRLRADARRVRQILLNLLSNAIKFTPQDGRVSIGVHCLDDGALALFVSDTGIGMNEQDIPVALAPFSQVDSSLSRRFDGTGLGLPLSLRLAELHQAKLKIESHLNQGTTVTVTFPPERAVLRARAVEPEPA